MKVKRRGCQSYSDPSGSRGRRPTQADRRRSRGPAVRGRDGARGRDPARALGEVAGNIRVGGFLPQAKVLECASAVVNHGGYNTVSAALGAGLPLFLIPMGADQPYNTERCISAGAALGVIQPELAGPPRAGPPTFSPPDPALIRDGTRRILDEPEFREAARAIAAEIAALPPADYAAERLEEAVLERQAARLDSSGAPVRAQGSARSIGFV